MQVMGLQHALAMVGGIVTPPLIISYLQDDTAVSNCKPHSKCHNCPKSTSAAASCRLICLAATCAVAAFCYMSVVQGALWQITGLQSCCYADLVASSLIVSGICTVIHVSAPLAPLLGVASCFLYVIACGS